MKMPKHSLSSRTKRGKKSKLKSGYRVDFGIVSRHRSSPELSGLRIGAGPHGIDLTRKLALAKRIALEGYTDEQLARIAGISPETLDYWKAAHPNLQEAIDSGRTELDGEMIASLYMLGVGYTRRVEEVAGKDAATVSYNKYFPPELGAIKTWLNARSSKFREVQRAEVTGKNGKPLVPKESRADLINSIVKLVNPKADGDDSKQDRNKKAPKK